MDLMEFVLDGIVCSKGRQLDHLYYWTVFLEKNKVFYIGCSIRHKRLESFSRRYMIESHIIRTVRKLNPNDAISEEKGRWDSIMKKQDFFGMCSYYVKTWHVGKNFFLKIWSILIIFFNLEIKYYKHYWSCVDPFLLWEKKQQQQQQLGREWPENVEWI